MRLARVVARVEAALVLPLRAEGLRLDEWRALELLATGPKRPMSDIAEATLISGPTLTRVIDRLVAAGLLHRIADVQDRRRVLVGLTRRGKALHQRLAAKVAGIERAALDSAPTREDLAAALDELPDPNR
nr:MarR family transcriptional regulator [Naumannella cuiyingiana]